MTIRAPRHCRAASVGRGSRAGLPARAAQALGRGPDGRRAATARIPSGSQRSHRRSATVRDAGVQVAIVVGGGNIFRGLAAAASGMDRATGRLHGHARDRASTRSRCRTRSRSSGVPTRVQSAITIAEVAEPYIRRRAIRHLEKGRVVIFAAGTGNPFFTTDTGGRAARARDRCRGDPDGHERRRRRVRRRSAHDAAARLLREVSHREALERDLR